MEHIKSLIDQVRKTGANLYGKDFLLTWQKTREELDLVLLVAEALKEMRANNISTRVFDSGLAVSLFRDNSTRTRFSPGWSRARRARLPNSAGRDPTRTTTTVSEGNWMRPIRRAPRYLRHKQLHGIPPTGSTCSWIPRRARSVLA